MWQCQRVSRSWPARLRGFQGQPADKEEDGGISDEGGPLLVPKSALVVSGCRHSRLRMLIDHLMCRDGELKKMLLERRAARNLAVRRVYQTAVGTFFGCVKENVCGDVEIDGA